jgi:anti-sigma B factor antagonist
MIFTSQNILHEVIKFQVKSPCYNFLKGALPMEISSTPYKRCDLVQVSGRVDSFTAPNLSETLRAVTDAGRFKIALDMAGVTYVSSAGLRVLIDTQKTCKALNRGELVLACVPPRIYETLDLAGFVPLFKFFDDITAAVGSF